MSNALAIAAVTATLQNLIQGEIAADIGLDLPAGIRVTAQTPKEARDSSFANQINLFLYHVTPNAAWRNTDIPQKVRSGETAMPLLPLNLYYLLTAYSRENAESNEITSHRLLGRAMSILHDHCLLGPEEIRNALSNNDLYTQVERVRITLQPISLEEISKLWVIFQVEYQVSVAYEVSVVLIESIRPTRTPLPVVTRGPKDSGIPAQANIVPPFPTIEKLVLPHPPSALMRRNDPADPTSNDLTLKGHHLLPGPDPTKPPEQQIDNTRTRVRFMNPRWAAPTELAPKPGSVPTAYEMTVTLPFDPPHWPAGFYTIAVVFRNTNGDVVRTSNELSFSLAPSITIDPPAITRDANNKITKMTLQVHCTPAVQRTVLRKIPGIEQPQEVLQEQRVSLLVGDREVPFVFPAQSTIQDLTFEITDHDVRPLPPGKYFVRLRVDGVDSLLVDRGVQPPQFDESQSVVIPS